MNRGLALLYYSARMHVIHFFFAIRYEEFAFFVKSPYDIWNVVDYRMYIMFVVAEQVINMSRVSCV